MNSTIKIDSCFADESAAVKRERRLQRRHERERAHRASEIGEQREERLSRRIVVFFQSVDRKKTMLVQLRREKLDAEYPEQRDVRLSR